MRDSKGRFIKGNISWHKGKYTYSNCIVCNKKIRIMPSRESKFCGHSCAMKYRWGSGELKNRKKVEPWNKNMKGIHLSPQSEFKYQGNSELVKGRSEFWWRQQARQIMKLEKNDSRIVHHIDGDITNNEENNLKIMERGEHTSLHHKQGDIQGGVLA